MTMPDMRDIIAGLAGGATALGGNINRRKERREAQHDREESEQRAEDRAMRMLLAKPSKDDTQVVTGTDEQGPGIFLVDKQKGTKKRILNADEAMAKLTGAPPTALPTTPPSVPTDDTETHGFTGDPSSPFRDAPPAPRRSLGLTPTPKVEKPPAADPTQLVLGPNGTYIPANRRTGLGPDGQPVTAYKPPVKQELVEVETPEGKRVLKPKVEGLEVPGPTSTGAASIRKAVADNRSQLSVIDDAIRELDAHPESVGVKRGLGIVPGMGKVGEMVNQRTDPTGVKARNALQNVSSLQIKSRSGSAVTPSEMERMGFIPSVEFDYPSNRQKLLDLKKYIETETNALEQGGAGPMKKGETPTKPPSDDPEFDAIMATVKKPKPPV